MISANDLRKGVTFVYDNDVYQIVDFQHVKPGKGAAFVRAKIRSVMNGGAKDVTFNPNEKFEQAVISTKEMSYIYNDGQLYYFMDPETFEQIGIEYEAVKDAIIYVKENEPVQIKFYEGKPFQIEAPNFVELKVEETEPAIKGDTATNVTKPATVETGAVIQVPVFVNVGDVIKIDTRTGDYLSRV